MMSFWLREIAGWILVGCGLLVFYQCYRLLVDVQHHRLLEAGPLTFIGFVLFRGGIHILKIAVAARLCRQDPKEPTHLKPSEGNRKGDKPETKKPKTVFSKLVP